MKNQLIDKFIGTIISLLVFSFTPSSSFGQKSVKLVINHQLGGAEFKMNTESQNNLGTRFDVKRLEYYISGLKLFHDGGQVTDLPDYVALIRPATDDTISLGMANITKLESIQFSIGVEQGRNHGDPSKYASGHPLSPKSPSMHWGWSAGYRFVAMEGKTGSSMNTTYEIHALGDELYFPIRLNTAAKDNGGDLVVDIKADYAGALQNIDVSPGVITHGDFDEAIPFLRNFSQEVFTTSSGSGNTLSTTKTEISGLKLSPNPSIDGSFEIVGLDGNDPINEVRVYDVTGKIINANHSGRSINIPTAGIYFVQIMGADWTETKRVLVQ